MLTQSTLEPMGLQYDRRWMVVDQHGKFISQRTHPHMALIQAEFRHEQLWLTHPSLDCIAVPKVDVPATERKTVTIWRDSVLAHPISLELDSWLTKALECRCSMVWIADDPIRECNQAYANPGDHTGFADAYPLLLISQASLDDLNSRLSEPVEMRRFRPNIVVSGCDAFAEDNWQSIRIGSIKLRVVKPCDRCPIPTVNPDTGLKEGPEPIKTLMTYRQKNNKVYFGQNLVHEKTGVLSIGDVVTPVFGE